MLIWVRFVKGKREDWIIWVIFYQVNLNLINWLGFEIRSGQTIRIFKLKNQSWNFSWLIVGKILNTSTWFQTIKAILTTWIKMLKLSLKFLKLGILLYLQTVFVDSYLLSSINKLNLQPVVTHFFYLVIIPNFSVESLLFVIIVYFFRWTSSVTVTFALFMNHHWIAMC